MLRALSSRSRRGYERLDEESAVSLLGLGGKLTRAMSVPARLCSRSKRVGGSVPVILEEFPRQKSAKKNSSSAANGSKFSHPIFSFLDARRRKKKTTAKPEFARYLEYLREGGMWDVRSNTPVIYYK